MYRFGLLFKQIFIAAAAMLPAALWGQALSGRVVECGSGQPLAGVAIRVAGSTNGTSTDGEGEFRLAASGDMVLEFSCTGMKPVRRTVRAPAGRPLRLDVCMEDAVTELGSVTVEARFERKSLKDAREQGVPVSVIDGKSLAGRGTSITEVINHQTGVKIRRTGNTGNDTKVNVRGLEGNRVQIYLDGYALNTPDGSFSINDIPLQFIERIEIYKGIVPPEFGGDGLGSAINIVTIDAQGSYYDAWYSLKSHNVSEGSLLYKHYFPKAKMYSAVMIGGEHSLNNYTMQSPYVEGLKIRRNHDRFRKVDGAVTFDFKERYFDEFEIENVFFVSDRQVQGIQTNIQHAVSSGWIAAITPKLEKRGFLTEKLDMKFVGLAGFGTSSLNDTSSYIYNFDGTRTPNSYRGELGSIPNLSNDKLQDYRYTLNLKYHLSGSSRLNLNNDFRFVTTTFNDLEADRYKQTSYSGYSANVTNVISSLNLEQRLWGRLTLLLTGRHYHYRVNGETVDLTYGMSTDVVHAAESRSTAGYSLAAKYDFAPRWLLKLAAEHNYRLPRSEELLGDRVRIVPNTKLRPEQADNLNLGVMFDKYYDGFARLQLEANTYAMSVTDMMMLRSSNGFLSNYNLGKAFLYGADAEVKWDVNRQWFLMANLTWQKAVDKMLNVPGSNTPSITYNKQMPHIPIFFVNWSVDYRKDNLFGGKGQYNRFYYEGGYTDKYYYGYNLGSNSSYVIPSAHIHTAGAEYALLDRRILLSLECHNIFNAKELTNLNYPLAGRTLQVKARITTMKW